MNIFYFSYTILSSVFFVGFLPFFWVYTRVTGRYADHFQERLGFIPKAAIQRLSGRPRFWIHAVSLGEVRVASAIIRALSHGIPGCSVVLSTTTDTGRRFAENAFENSIPVIYAPLDFAGAVCKALSAVRPDVMVFLETEIWPLWVRLAHQMGMKTVLINGRISPKSIKHYLKARLFFREILKNFDTLSMITQTDATRIAAMGAMRERIQINGNAKYDLLAGMCDSEAENRMRRVFNCTAHAPVFVAGSIRSGEECVILDAYEKMRQEFSDMVLIIVPRHTVRVKEIIRLVEKRGISYHLRTDLAAEKGGRTRPIVIVNTFGELFHIYSLGTIVFAGGSLFPWGGQNPLEPAVWRKVVFFGPHMENFMDAKALLEAVGAGVTVKDADALSEKGLWMLRHPEEMHRLGDQAREAVLAHEGAAEKHAAVLKRLVEKG